MRDVHQMTVTTDTVHLVPASIVAVMRRPMAAAEAKECHGCHARGSENHAENVEVHLILDVARVASPAQSRGELSPQIGVQQGAMTWTAFVPLHISGASLQSHPYFRPAARALLLFLLVAAGLSCGGSTSGPSVTMVASVTVSAPLKSIDVGKTAQLSAVAFDQTGAQLVGVTFQWFSSDKTIATVSNTGAVTGVAVGSARISATAGTVSGFADVTVGPMMTTQLTEKHIARG